MNSQQAVAQLEKIKKESKAAMRRGERVVADRITVDAKALAPGSLSSKIFVEQTEDMTQIVGGDELSAYVEFGTGIYAKEYVSSLPDDVQEEALKFFVTGEGRGQEHPFFFPSIFRHQNEITEAVDIELQKLAK